MESLLELVQLLFGIVRVVTHVQIGAVDAREGIPGELTVLERTIDVGYVVFFLHRGDHFFVVVAHQKRLIILIF